MSEEKKGPESLKGFELVGCGDVITHEEPAENAPVRFF